MKFLVIFKDEHGYEIVKLWADNEHEAKGEATRMHPSGKLVRAYKLNVTGPWS